MTLDAIITAVFVLGYALIAAEHKLRVNKAAMALLMCGIIWTVLMLGSRAAAEAEAVNGRMQTALGSTCEILVYLIGAMTIVNIVDFHGGFDILTRSISTRSKKTLVWILAAVTFCISSVLDNMTTTIVMVMLLRRIVPASPQRWLYACVIVIAANAGGAWSPIGDVTTLMLWTRGNVSAARLMASLIGPALLSVALPSGVICSRMHGDIVCDRACGGGHSRPAFVTERQSCMLLTLGLALLLTVPVYKSLTGMPPYMAMIIAIGIMWVVTEIMYDRKRDIEEHDKPRLSAILKHIDMPTILFFLGILMTVAALESAGILRAAAGFMDGRIHNVYAISALAGLLSAVIDNVALVAASIGMYPLTEHGAGYALNFAADGTFWHLLAFSAGMGGCLLIIGSAAGVVAMGLEKIPFGWYLRNITPIALLGYLAGTALYACQMWLIG